MQCFAAWVGSCDGLCRTQTPRSSLFKLHAWYSWYRTATRLDLHLECYLCRTSLELNTSREPEPGAWPLLHASWSCFEELCGRAFSTAYVTSLCLQSVSGSAVWIQTWRAPCPHSDTTRFWPSCQWISAPVFCACSQQSSMASLSLRSSVGYAESLQPFRTQIVLAVWQHFGNHLSYPCATCALNLAWLDCHCYRHGMNCYRSPRVRWIVDGALFCVGLCQTPNAQRYAHQWLEFSLPPLLPWRAWLEEHQACNAQVRTTDHPWASLGPAMLLGDSSARLMRCCPQENLYMGFITVYDFVQWSFCQHL